VEDTYEREEALDVRLSRHREDVVFAESHVRALEGLLMRLELRGDRGDRIA